MPVAIAAPSLSKAMVVSIPAAVAFLALAQALCLLAPIPIPIPAPIPTPLLHARLVPHTLMAQKGLITGRVSCVLWQCVLPANAGGEHQARQKPHHHCLAAQVTFG